MFGKSVVAKTGQSWKLVVAIVLMVVGSFAPLWEGFGINWTVGTILVIVGYAFGIWFIVCPGCGIAATRTVKSAFAEPTTTTEPPAPAWPPRWGTTGWAWRAVRTGRVSCP